MVERHRRIGRESGFTLLELLIAITILSLIVIALTGGVRFAGQAWDMQERTSARRGDIDAVQNLLRRLVASAHSFRGDAGSLRFVGALPVALARGGLYDIELHQSADRLLLAWKPHFKGPSTETPTTETELVNDVAAFELAYYGGEEGWQDMTAEGPAAPALVRVRVAFADKRTWPPLMLAPMVEASQGDTE